MLEQGKFDDVTTVLNSAGWVFDDAEQRYTIGLVTIVKDPTQAGVVGLRGPYASMSAFKEGKASKLAEMSADYLLEWSDGASFPLLPRSDSLDVFRKLRAQPSLDSDEQPWRARPVTEFHATNDKHHLILDPGDKDGLWPVYKGASFDIWNPDTVTYYAWADPDRITQVLQEKRLRQAKHSRSAFSELLPEWATDITTLPCLGPRIAFRDVTRATDSRTVRAALVPPRIVMTNQAPYLLWATGDERDQAFLLGVLCSIPLDWYARRVVETHVNFHLFNTFPIPAPQREDSMRRRVEEIAGCLAAVDDRYTEWAHAVGVSISSVDEDSKAELIPELDAAVAHLYQLSERDVRHIYDTFHVGWDATDRLNRVLTHYRRLG